MPNIYTDWRTERPTEGYYAAALPADPALAVRTFLPEHYEPRYPYPLLVLFHAKGGNEEHVLRLAPKLSRRNYVAISLRAPTELGVRPNGDPACDWGDNGGDTETLVDYVLAAVEQTRRLYHVHSERVFLVGVQEGATAAYRAAFALGDRVAGVVAMNGLMPRPLDSNPIFRLEQVRRLQAMLCHTAPHAAHLLPDVLRDHRVLYAAGAGVHLQQYRAPHPVPGELLRDVNRWLIDQVNTAESLFAPAGR